MKSWRRAVAVLAGRPDRALLGALVGQLDAARHGTEVALDMVVGRVTSGSAREQLSVIEHAGDAERGRLVEILSRSIAPPVDREDLFRLSRSIDDVVDALRDFVRESDLYGLSDQSTLAPILESIVDGVASLSDAVLGLVNDPSRITEGALRAKKISGITRRLHQDETARLLSSQLTAQSLQARELIRRLEMVGTRIEEAADALADGAMKRWH